MPVTSAATPANYSARKIVVDSVEVIRLADVKYQTEVSLAPSMGNIAYDLKVKGNKVLWSSFETLAQWVEKPAQLGIPFLAPWANRLDQDAYWANGKLYRLNPDAGNFRHDPNGQPIHGLLVFSKDWQVVSLRADAHAAEVTSRLEFWKHPDWMAQFPFAHTIEMTHRLADGVLEVRVSVENHSLDPLPLSLGFHPWYQITDCPRDEWRVHLPVRDHYPLSDKTIPTGATERYNLPESFTLAGRQLDDVYGGVNPEDDFSVAGKSQKIAVRFGPKYPAAVVFAPANRSVICFEPMTGITNAFNLAHAGIYHGLQSVPAGAKWTESFWIKPSGY